MKRKINKIGAFFGGHMDDILILAGLTDLIITTFIVNLIAGLYTLGAVLFLMGVFLAVTSARKG